MQTYDDDDQFIPYIHNYCDRWCERCEFTSRCRVFSQEREMTEEEKDVDNDAFVQNLLSILSEAKGMLRKKAEEFGIELDADRIDEAVQKKKQKRTIVRSDEMARLAQEYAMLSGPLLEAKEDWTSITPDDEDIHSDVFRVLYWYQYFIAAKLQRGLNGILNDDGDEVTDEVDDVQSDANGSVKVALIAIERSILAWTFLLNSSNSNLVTPMITLLKRLEDVATKKFPNARDFLRPGFDEIETVM